MRHLPQKTIVCVIGTRPEAIKMAPVINALEATSWARCRVLLTGQHRELVDELLPFFGIEPHVDLDVMRKKLPLERLAAYLVDSIAKVLVDDRPHMVLAQGDTTTVAATALACWQHGIPLGHVEAGLRTGQLFSPFPEEANRIVASHLSAIHFAPTASARLNLIREGVKPRTIFVTGNTVIDALLSAARRDIAIGVELDSARRLVLVTAHRRDSFGAPLRRICRAVADLHARFDDVEFLWPVHPNPSVRPVVEELMRGFARVHLCRPLAYGPFVSAMKRAAIILTDSGGVQEEAPALGRPVLVLRNESERPEAIEAGVARLVGQDVETIVSAATQLLADPIAYRSMARGASPYGDGHAAARITSIVRRHLGIGRVAASPVNDFRDVPSRPSRRPVPEYRPW
jgi:UDP-N-acetylglucosamine 2-epimerase (non-hydrolysing)